MASAVVKQKHVAYV